MTFTCPYDLEHCDTVSPTVQEQLEYSPFSFHYLLAQGLLSPQSLWSCQPFQEWERCSLESPEDSQNTDSASKEQKKNVIMVVIVKKPFISLEFLHIIFPHNSMQTVSSSPHTSSQCGTHQEHTRIPQPFAPTTAGSTTASPAEVVLLWKTKKQLLCVSEGEPATASAGTQHAAGLCLLGRTSPHPSLKKAHLATGTARQSPEQCSVTDSCLRFLTLVIPC